MTKDAFMSAFTFESFKCEVSFNEIVDTYTGDKTKSRSSYWCNLYGYS